ncbi:AlpA family transcriptional regulator [uncultured Methylophaga sp.]|uniref:helix-turn-helix transcriptional regulator n=1 Tax=uncultured Methylophaga sp. TaxID=285271 RepID=UPI00261FAC6B|nr:AlpA family transcriptional regulator [uncultured Methylophaga sp.]
MSQLIKLPEVIKLTGLSSASVYRLAAAKKFPSPIKLSPGGRSSAWVAEEVQSWIDERIAAARGGEVL